MARLIEVMLHVLGMHGINDQLLKVMPSLYEKRGMCWSM